MDFSLTEEQRAIADMAGSLFRDSCSDDVLRELSDSGQTRMEGLWQASIETGLHSLYIPEAAGGSGLGITELMLVLMAQGSALAQVPLWRHQLAAAAIWQSGVATESNALHAVVLAAAEGANVLTLADTLQSGPTLTRSDKQLTINGTCYAVAEAPDATLALIPVSDGDKLKLVALPLDTPGVSCVSGVMTHGEAVADIHCQQVTLDSDYLLDDSTVAWLQPRITAALSALQLGLSSQQLTRTVEYISQRRQFDRQIGTFQAVQMTMADCQVALEALQSCLWQLCYRIDNALACEPEMLATAWHACEAGHLIGHKAQHVHGGFGVDISYPIHRFLYWSRAIRLALGGSGATLTALGDWLNNNNSLGWKYDLDENA